ncbi:MAG: APC family permease [Candidatus Thermoplasmatota archaeon]|nr:APC family permease [Candidatus Thermoplasmatota archaeon]
MEPSSLHKNVGGLWAGVFQSIAFIAPAAVAASFLVVETGYVGASTTFVFFLAIIGVSSAMYMNYVFSGKIAHAGGYYAYVRAGLGPKFGVFSGWLYFINVLGALSGFAVLFFAGVLWPMIPSLSSNPIGWIPLAFIPLSIILLLYRGLKPSLAYTIIGALIEISFLIGISIAIIIKAGPANSLIPFTPNGNSFGNLGFATLFSILGFVGVGSVITLSEELRNPRKNIRKAIFIAMGITAVVYILVSYSMVIGWGITKMSSFSAATNPGFTVVNNYFGPIVMTVFIIITLNSFISNGIAEGNAFSREGFALARDGVVFPKWMAVVHKRFGSPHKVIVAEWFIIVLLTLIGGLIFGPMEGAAIITAVNGVVLYIVHILANFSLPVYGKKTLRMKAKGLLPLALGPVLSTVVYAFAIYGEFVPFPSYPTDVGAYGIIAAILVGVVLVILTIHRKSKVEIESIGTEKESISELASKTP